jgi:hypothetical protein
MLLLLKPNECLVSTWTSPELARASYMPHTKLLLRPLDPPLLAAVAYHSLTSHEWHLLINNPSSQRPLLFHMLLPSRRFDRSRLLHLPLRHRCKNHPYINLHGHHNRHIFKRLDPRQLRHFEHTESTISKANADGNECDHQRTALPDLFRILGELEEASAAFVDIDEGIDEDNGVEKGGDGGAEGEPEHVEGLDPAGKDFHFCGRRGGVRVGGGRGRARGEETRDPGEEGDVDDHKGAEVEVGQDVGGCVYDLAGGE